MNVYISGISGTGMGPLALMAKQAGLHVCGSDLAKGAVYDELVSAGIAVSIGPQDGKFLQECLAEGVDWFVYTSALPADHTELVLARKMGVKCTKRDDFTAYLVETLHLKMIAVAGTHGKTTTTAMIIWAALNLKLPVSYIAGTTLGFAPSGAYHHSAEYFIYEADEYDRNFLKYHPWLAILPAVSYDHPDIYPTKKDYLAAFQQFKSQSQKVLEHISTDDRIKLAGAVRRQDATLALAAISSMAPDISEEKIIKALNSFPGVGRRFEKIADSVYTDYAHHPEEIAATIDTAREECTLTHKKGVVVVYQPHQNTRQHEVRSGYMEAFTGAEKLYWLPTYLTREDPHLPVLTPAELISGLKNSAIAEPAELNDALAAQLRQYINDGYLILLMTAGPADTWLRQNFGK